VGATPRHTWAYAARTANWARNPSPLPGRAIFQLKEGPRRMRGSRKRNGDGGETAIVFCRDVQVRSCDRSLDSPAARELSSLGETRAS